MDVKKRKVGFYYLVADTDDIDLDFQGGLRLVFNYIDGLDRASKKRDQNDTRFYLIESSRFNEVNTFQKVIFKSAHHSYRPNLMDKDTTDERENPKRMEEGEVNKTHCVIQYNQNDEVLLLLEMFRGGVTINSFQAYINYFIFEYNQVHDVKLNFRVKYEIIAKDNFREELDNLQRVVAATVFVDKQLLGGEALNYSDRIQSVKTDFTLEVKANRSDSIKDFAYDVFAKLNGGDRTITKIRIKGKSEANNDVTIDTSFIEKREYVNAQINEDTGEVNSQNILFELSAITQNL